MEACNTLYNNSKTSKKTEVFPIRNVMEACITLYNNSKIIF